MKIYAFVISITAKCPHIKKYQILTSAIIKIIMILTFILWKFCVWKIYYRKSFRYYQNYNIDLYPL